MGDDLLPPVSQTGFRQGILTRHSLVVNPTERQDQGDEDAGPVLPCCAVEKQWRRWPLCDVA